MLLTVQQRVNGFSLYVWRRVIDYFSGIVSGCGEGGLIAIFGLGLTRV